MLLVTPEALRQRARRRYEALAAVSTTAADEAAEQAGLPEAWAWDTMPVRRAQALALACAIRLLDAGHALT